MLLLLLPLLSDFSNTGVGPCDPGVVLRLRFSSSNGCRLPGGNVVGIPMFLVIPAFPEVHVFPVLPALLLALAPFWILIIPRLSYYIML